MPHIINTDFQPFIPEGWTIEEHRKGGDVDLSSIELYLHEDQKTGTIQGHKLREHLRDKPALNACVMDYLLAHPELIPESWKGKAIFFWGTIYRHTDGNLCVRYLRWNGGGWDWYRDRWLAHDWDDFSPCAVLASPLTPSVPDTEPSPLDPWKFCPYCSHKLT